MMRILDERCRNEYAVDDWVSAMKDQLQQPGDDNFVSHRWLRESMAKRMVYAHMYGDLLMEITPEREILDVGGGFSSLTRRLLARHRYQLVDIGAHDDEELLREEERRAGHSFWMKDDWYDLESVHQYDLVVANDLFPNVDQRLREFLTRFLPRCREMRLLLTYYENGRWYRVQRIDADEIFCVMAWDGATVERVLSEQVGVRSGLELHLLREPHESAFSNGRQVCMVTLTGGLMKP